MVLESYSYPRDYRVRREASALAGTGHRVSVICPSEPGQPWMGIVDSTLVYGYPAPRTRHGFLAYAWEYGYSLKATI